MAKKVRKKLEEEKELQSFEFPIFDEGRFIVHELEQSLATVLALVLMISIAVLSWLINYVGLPWYLPPVLGIGVIAFSPVLIQRLRPPSHDYTRGEWATLIMLQFFGWLGLWFLLLDVLPGPVH